MIRLLLLIVLAALYIYAVSAQDIAIAISVPVGIGLLFATNAAINIAEESRQIYHRSWDRPISGETEHTATQTLDNATSATNDQSEGEEQVSAEIDPNDYEPQVVLEKLRAQEHPNQKIIMVGVGTQCINRLEHLIGLGLEQVGTIAIDSNLQTLSDSNAQSCIHISDLESSLGDNVSAELDLLSEFYTEAESLIFICDGSDQCKEILEVMSHHAGELGKNVEFLESDIFSNHDFDSLDQELVELTPSDATELVTVDSDQMTRTKVRTTHLSMVKKEEIKEVIINEGPTTGRGDKNGPLKSGSFKSRIERLRSRSEHLREKTVRLQQVM